MFSHGFFSMWTWTSCSSYKDNSHIRLRPDPYYSYLALVTSLKVIPPNIEILGVKASIYEFGRNTIQSITFLKIKSKYIERICDIKDLNKSIVQHKKLRQVIWKDIAKRQELTFKILIQLPCKILFSRVSSPQCLQ